MAVSMSEVARAATAAAVAKAAAATNDGVFCNACGIAFVGEDEQRAHYRTDFHRYNLKRRVANLGPVSEALFRARCATLATTAAAAAAPVLAAKAGATPTTTSAPAPRIRCKLTGKTFATREMYEQHLRSKKYRQLLQEAREALERAAADPVAAAEEAAKEAERAAAKAKPAAARGSRAGDDESWKTRIRRLVGRAGMGADEDEDAEGEGEGEEEGKVSGAARRKGASSSASSAAAAGSAEGAEDDDEEEEEEEGAADPLESYDPAVDAMSIFSHCMFCATPVDGLEAHLEHANKEHSFFIADQLYLKDLEGLVTACMAKILVGCSCLYCDRRFATWQACQQHMTDKSHARMPFDINGGVGMDIFDEFYDFSSRRVIDRATLEEGPIYDDEEEEGEEGAARGGGKDGDDEERPRVPRAVLLPSGEIQLASGEILGHRSLKTYYKQKFTPADSRTAIVVSRREYESRVLRRAGYDEAALASAERGGDGRFAITAAARHELAAKSFGELRAEADRTNQEAIRDLRMLAVGMGQNIRNRLRFRKQTNV